MIPNPTDGPPPPPRSRVLAAPYHDLPALRVSDALHSSRLGTACVLAVIVTPRRCDCRCHTCTNDTRPLFGELYELVCRCPDGMSFNSAAEELRFMWRDSHSSSRKTAYLLEKLSLGRSLLCLDRVE